MGAINEGSGDQNRDNKDQDAAYRPRYLDKFLADFGIKI